jgi:hypothetical protein
MNLRNNPNIDWDKRRALETQYDAADDAGHIGHCDSCQSKDTVLCLNCGFCFRYCHPFDDCETAPVFYED